MEMKVVDQLDLQHLPLDGGESALSDLGLVKSFSLFSIV